MPGYSGRPLAARLGVVAGQRVLLVDAAPITDHAAAMTDVWSGLELVRRPPVRA